MNRLLYRALPLRLLINIGFAKLNEYPLRVRIWWQRTSDNRLYLTYQTIWVLNELPSRGQRERDRKENNEANKGVIWEKDSVNSSRCQMSIQPSPTELRRALERDRQNDRCEMMP